MPSVAGSVSIQVLALSKSPDFQSPFTIGIVACTSSIPPISISAVALTVPNDVAECVKYNVKSEVFAATLSIMNKLTI